MLRRRCRGIAQHAPLWRRAPHASLGLHLACAHFYSRTPTQERRAASSAKDAAKEAAAAANGDAAGPSDVAAAAAAEGVEIEYVAAPLPFEDGGDGDGEEGFGAIFRRFESRAAGGADADADAADAAAGAEAAAVADAGGEDDDAGDGEGEGGEAALSKKKLKALRRMAIGELKQHCRRPEVVEVWDVTAPDPTLLVHLKAYRNSVPVPRHWSQKR